MLRGSIINYVAYPTIIDQQTGRASGLQVNVTLQISLTERATGKVIYSRPSFEAHQRYELSINANTYFEESDAALDRLARDVARDLGKFHPGKFLMSPEQYLQRLRKGPPAPVSLFIGPELYQLGICRRALVEKFLAPEDRENGLYAPRYGIHNLVAHFGRRAFHVAVRAAACDLGGRRRSRAASRPIFQLRRTPPAPPIWPRTFAIPTPGTVLIFVSSRYDFEGDDRAKLERVEKFYSCIPEVVEFRPYTVESARQLAQNLASRRGIATGSLRTWASGGFARRRRQPHRQRN